MAGELEFDVVVIEPYGPERCWGSGGWRIAATRPDREARLIARVMFYACMRPGDAASRRALGETKRVPGVSEACDGLGVGAVLAPRNEVIHSLDDARGSRLGPGHRSCAPTAGWTARAECARASSARAAASCSRAGSEPLLPPIPGRRGPDVDDREAEDERAVPPAARALRRRRRSRAAQPRGRRLCGDARRGPPRILAREERSRSGRSREPARARVDLSEGRRSGLLRRAAAGGEVELTLDDGRA